MAGPLTWWANRKSRLGLNKVISAAPPHVHGKPWWTSPPIAPPQPEHIEYVLGFQREIQGKSGPHHQKLMMAVSDWITVARQLLHESVESDDGELHTTDGLFIRTDDMIHNFIGRLVKGGYKIGAKDQATIQAIQARAARSLRERAMERGTVTKRKAMP